MLYVRLCENLRFIGLVKVFKINLIKLYMFVSLLIYQQFQILMSGSIFSKRPKIESLIK